MDHGRCSLQDAVGRVEACPGESCPFWDAGQGACVLAALAGELPERPDVAQHFLELRRELEGRPVSEAPSLFYRLRDGRS
jgi:hypothetical protein